MKLNALTVAEDCVAYNSLWWKCSVGRLTSRGYYTLLDLEMKCELRPEAEKSEGKRNAEMKKGKL